jgi:ion channel-forming bestrophin family protein
MATLAKGSWFSSAVQMKGSILPRILPRMTLFCLFAIVAIATYKEGLWSNSENLRALTSNVACNLVLGLLLVFRTNTAYERFWEGRKAWGTLTITTRNLARDIQVSVATPTEADRLAKNNALNKVVSFAIALKCQLRNESPIDQLKDLLPPAELAQLEKAPRPPQLITLWISHYLKQQEDKGNLDSLQSMSINSHINSLVEALCGCERIVKTPMPLSYGIYLKRLTLLYCLLLPLGLVGQLGWWTVSAIALVSFVLLGVEEIGNEIENPFGYDFNDLKLDDICNTLRSDLKTVQAFSSDGTLNEIVSDEQIKVSANPESVTAKAL